MATEVEARFRVLTPLFCSGAYPDRPELRMPSCKGVMRFWWRALAWPRLDGDLSKIQREEDALFGSSAGGQYRLSMRIAALTAPESASPLNVFTVPGGRGLGARYLGYGAIEALLAPFVFTVRLHGRSLSDIETRPLKND